jgi:hypothetical protein
MRSTQAQMVAWIKLSWQWFRGMLARSAVTRLALVGLPLIATTNAWSGGIGSHGVKRITVHDSGHLLIALSSSSNSETCVSSGAERDLLVRRDHPQFKYFYATAALALASARPVSGWVEGCTEVWGPGSTRVATLINIEIEQ